MAIFTNQMQLFIVFLCTVAFVTSSHVKVLTDANFETDTQVSSGATTGEWFVEFYAPWCGHCKALEPVYEVVAEKLDGKVNIAKLDATENPATAKRFKVKGFPTLKFFSHGLEYSYEGNRTESDLLTYATGGYKKTKGVKATPPPTFLSILHENIDAYLNEYITSYTPLVYTVGITIISLFIGGFVTYQVLIAQKIIQSSKRSGRMKTALEVIEAEKAEKEKKKKRN